jgi:excisionase family DNA binding protein
MKNQANYLNDYPDVMNIEQMCEILSISTKTGYKILRDNQIINIRIGRSYRIPKIHILDYLKIVNNIDAQK